MDHDELGCLTLPGMFLGRKAARRLIRILRRRRYGDLSITAANVAKVSGGTQTFLAGANFTAGEPFYISNATTSPSTIAPCLNDTLAHAAVAGITLGAANTGQPIVGQLPAPSGSVITIGATVAVGSMYVISANTGKIAIDSDLTTNEWVSDIGRATTTTSIQFTGTQWGIQHA